MFRDNLKSVSLMLLLLAGLPLAAADELSSEPQTVVSVGAPVFDLAVSSSGKHIAFGGKGGLLGVMDAGGKVLWTTEEYNKVATDNQEPVITGVGIDPEGNVLWITKERKERAATLGYRADAHITSVGFVPTPDGDAVVAGSWDTTLRFFAATTGEFLYRPAELKPVSREATEHGTIISSRPGTIRPELWQEMTNGRMRRWPHINSLAVAPNGKWLAFVTSSNVLEQWGCQFGRPGDITANGDGSSIKRIQLVDGKRDYQFLGLHKEPLAISLDGQYLITGGQLVLVLRARDLALISRFSADASGGGYVSAVACRPHVQGLEIAVAKEHGKVALWRVNTDVEPVESYRSTELSHRPIKFAVPRAEKSKGKAPLPAAEKRSPQEAAARKPVNMPTCQQVFNVESLGQAHEYVAKDMAFSPDGHYLVTAGSTLNLMQFIAKFYRTAKKPGEAEPQYQPNFVRVWDVDTGRMIGQFGNVGNSALAVAVSPDGKTIYAGFEDGTIHLWPMPTGEFVATP